MKKLQKINGDIKLGNESFVLDGVALPTGFWGDEPEKNTEEMIKRWNSHDDLVEALKLCADMLKSVYKATRSTGAKSAYEHADKVLDKLK